MIDLNELYQKVNTSPNIKTENSNYYIACPIPGYPKHKLARDMQSNPCLLISTDSLKEPTRPAPIKLKHLSVLFDVECKVFHDGSFEKNRFTVICCTEQDQVMRNYFLRISSTIISAIGKKPSRAEIFNAVDKLIELFRTLSQAPRKSVQGLWAELFLISLSPNPESLITAWHQSPLDKYDFNADDQRIEVKSNTSGKRIHHFSLEQLKPTTEIKVLIASVFVERVGTGMSIMELSELVRSRIDSNSDLLFYLERIIGLTLGKEWQSAATDRFDYNLAKRSLMYYLSDDIPCITSEIPKGVSEVHFVANLEAAQTVDKKTLNSSGGIFKAALSR